MHKLTGNKFWKLRSVHGKDKIFGDANLLWDEATAYFDWCDRNPWYKSELVKYKGGYDEADVSVGRPYSLSGLTIYLGVSESYFRTAKRQLNEKREKGKSTPMDLEIIEVIERIEQTVRTQQVEGATVGVFNANIVARINGISENINQNNTGETILRVDVRDNKTAKDLEQLDEDLT